MATKACQAPAPAMPGRAAAGGGNGRGPMGALPPPRRGQFKEKIAKDVVAALAAMAAGLVRADRTCGRRGVGGVLPLSADAEDK